MNNYYKHIKLFVKRILLLLVLFELSRLFFLLNNLSYFDDLKFWEGIKIFLYGLHFDIFVIFFLNIPLILLSTIPGEFKNKKYYQIILRAWFFIINGLFLFVNFIDAEYFKFNYQRSNAGILKFLNTGGGEVSELIPEFIRDFWYVILCWLIVVVGAWIIYPKFKNNKPEKGSVKLSKRIKNYGFQFIIMVVISATLMLFARGFGYKPISNLTAAKYTSSHYIPLILNTPFSIFTTLSKQQLELHEYFEEDELNGYFSPDKRYNCSKGFRDDNVVIIILESFSKEYSGFLNNNEGYTPFLDSLIKHSLVFPNSFANGKRSMDAIPAIVASIPSIMNSSFIVSNYSTNKINSLGSLLKSKGYHTSFFHGGNNGTMGFYNFLKLAGFDEYYGLNEYGNNNDHDGNWGIFDEEYLIYYADQLNTFGEPFLSTVFTLSSHHPYAIPEKYKGKFKEGPAEIMEVVGYTDYALKKFFQKAAKMSWYDNTLFVLVADHTGRTVEKKYCNQVGSHSIPIIFFHPGDSCLTGVDSIVTQQTDIMPSVLDYLGYDHKFIAYGNSVFDTICNHFAVNYSNNLYQILYQNYSLNFDGNKSISLFDYMNDSLLKINLVNENIDLRNNVENYLKAFIQHFNADITGNEMIIRDE